MMTTPICDFIEKYADTNPVRAHVPGHKGNGEIERFDITEIEGADVLYSASGIIAESEQNAARIFGTAQTLYSVEGSSLSIRAMLYLIKLYAVKNGKKPKILAARNAHKVFINTAALLDIDVEWVFPADRNYISCVIPPQKLDDILARAAVLPTAVYVTSPDYLGNISDIKGLSEVCEKYGVLLAVDNAHGAYLNFLKSNNHPIFLGADICCDSAHKTLPCLTGCGYLHISKRAPRMLADEAERAMRLFASTSPSYLLLRSLDKVNPYLSGDFQSELADCCRRISKMKQTLNSAGYELIGNEPLKITIHAKKYGYTGLQLAEVLKRDNIYCEFADQDFLVLMFTPQNKSDIETVCRSLLKIKKSTAIQDNPPEMPPPVCEVPPKDAIILPSQVVPVTEAVGKVLADADVSCPPAVPIVSCGERIDENAVRALEYYGVEYVRVLSGKLDKTIQHIV